MRSLRWFWKHNYFLLSKAKCFLLKTNLLSYLQADEIEDKMYCWYEANSTKFSENLEN